MEDWSAIAKVLHAHHSAAWVDLDITECAFDEGRTIEIETIALALANALCADVDERRRFVRAALTNHVVLPAARKARH